MLLLASIVAWQAYIRPVYFFLQTVTVAGNQRVTTDEIFRMAGFSIDSGPLWVWDAKDFLATLGDDLRVAEVKTEYDFPSTLTIRIRERIAVAYLASQHGFLDLDAGGVVLSASFSLTRMEAPLITGYKAVRVFHGNRIDDPGVNAVLDYLVALDKETRDKISEVNITAKKEAIAVTLNNIKIRLGPLERIRSKAKLTQEILQEINAKSFAVDSIDLVYDAPVLRFKRQ